LKYGLEQGAEVSWKKQFIPLRNGKRTNLLAEL
jgi:hypothetical protein